MGDMALVGAGVVVAGGATQSSMVIGPKGLIDHAHADDHVILEILVPGNEGVSILIFETDALGDTGPGIKTVEVFDRRDDRIGRIMEIDRYAQWEPRLIW